MRKITSSYNLTAVKYGLIVSTFIIMFADFWGWPQWNPNNEILGVPCLIFNLFYYLILFSTNGSTTSELCSKTSHTLIGHAIHATTTPINGISSHTYIIFIFNIHFVSLLAHASNKEVMFWLAVPHLVWF